MSAFPTPSSPVRDLFTVTNDSIYANITDGVNIDCVINNHYQKNRQIYMLPIASPLGFLGNSTAFVQLAAPTLLWICDWTVAKKGIQPTVPSPLPLDPNWVLLSDWWQPHNLDTGGTDGETLLFRVSGTYIYGHVNPALLTSQNIVFPLAPWLDGSVIPPTTRIMSVNFLKQGLSDISAIQSVLGGARP